MDVLVIGMGYVGSVAAVGLARVGHNVLATDIDQAKIQALRSGQLPINEPGLKELLDSCTGYGHLSFKHLSEIDEINARAIMISVGTPSRIDGAADLKQVKEAICWVRDRVVVPTTIIMKSTVPPGTGRCLISQYLVDSPSKISYISNPEFLREGQAVNDWFSPDRIVIGGEDRDSIELVGCLYAGIDAPIVVTNVTSAELIKYAANAFLAMKISFINEIAHICDYLGADINSVANGVGLDQRIGYQFLKAGIGYGGSCFPKDVRALDYLSMVNGYNFELLRAVINVNNRQRILAVRKLRNVLGNLSGKTIAVLGLSFKPGTDDIREAPAIDIIRMLIDEGASVKAHDPVAISNAKKIFPNNDVTFCDFVWDALQHVQAVILATEWEEYINLNWELIKNIMNQPYLIIDGRNCLKPDELMSMGFVYYGIGRGVLAKDGIQNAE